MRTKIILFALLVLLIAYLLLGHAQCVGESQQNTEAVGKPPTETPSVGEYHHESAKAFLKNGALDSAQTSCRAALAEFEKTGDLSFWLLAKRVEADISLKKSNDPFQPIGILKDALTKLPRQPQNEKDYTSLCALLQSKSWLEKKAENYVALTQDLEWAYQIYSTKMSIQNPDIAEYILIHLGNGYVMLGEYEGAKRIFEEGIRIGAVSPKVAKFNDYGSLYLTLKNYREAIRIFRQGLSFPNLPSEEIPLLLLNEVECLARLDSFDQAMASNQQASLAIEGLGRKHRRYARYKTGLLENYAIIYHGQAKAGNKASFPKAVAWYDETLEFANNPEHKAANRDIAGYQIAKAELQSDWGRHTEALKTYHQAVGLLLPNFETGVAVQPSSGKLTAEKMLYRALHGKARAFQALNQPEKALECYELIPFVEAKLRATHAYESSSLLALKESRLRFDDAIDIAWQLFERSNGNPQYAERAFRLTELARGMLLLQSLVQARQFLPEDIREKDYDLRVRMAWLEHQIADERENGEKTDKKKIDEWEHQLFDLKLERQKLLADFPSYNNPDSLFLQVLAAKDVRNLLRPGQAVLNFFLTETTAYIFNFEADGNFSWRKTKLTEGFRPQTKAFAAYLGESENKGREQFLRRAWQLDSLLIAPERKRLGSKTNSLIIVPDDVLMLVPFEVLLSSPSSVGSTWREKSWLLADYNFSYAYSATLLSVQKGISEEHEKAAVKPSQVFGGFAPSYSNSSAYKLENTRPMTKKICNLLGGKAWLGEESSEANFKNSAANYRTLLLAMHGISDNEYPELSRLLFGDSGPDSLINNNILYASELQIMRLQADLVVLSACHSGSGKLEQGEGIYSLARAFAAARVPATVMSLWLLHENTAPPLVEAFFQYLQQGKTKDEALRLAKLDFIKNDDNFEMTHPFFWAGLAASGDMRALDLPMKQRFEWGWWVLGAVIAVATGIGIWKRRRTDPLRHP